MKRSALLAALAGTLVAGSAAVSAGGQEPPASAGPTDLTGTLTLRQADFIVVPARGERPPARGDRLIGNGRLTGSRSARLDLVGTFVDPRTQRIHWVGTLVFTDGDQVAVQGIERSAQRTLRLAITGGTGAYAGARGVATNVIQSDRDGRAVSELTLDFV